LDQVRERRRHLDEIVELGHPAYPSGYSRTHTVTRIVVEFSQKTGEELEADPPSVRTAGRIRSVRRMGKKVAFIDLHDGRNRVQVYAKKDLLGDAQWALFERFDLGDHIGVAGTIFRTKSGELSVLASELTFLVKALTPPPDPYYGLKDPELRHRQRYADLLANAEVREVFERRARIVREIRAYFDEHGYVEVETPMLTPLATGAAARPFVTHHNALDLTLYARIAPELYLKRLTVGGFERVYEINRNFRNEGLSPRHNPEFTMLEFYQAYSDYEELIGLTQELLTRVALTALGTTKAPYQGREIDFGTWKRLTMRQAVVEFWPTGGPAGDEKPTLEDVSSRERLVEWVRRARLDVDPKLTYGKLLEAAFDATADSSEEHLFQPTFITEYPAEISPLSKQSPSDPAWVDRFELFIGKMEIANGFSELNDPEEQRRRFEQQMSARAGGDDEAMVLDEDYIRALSYGLPPTAGEGVGIDRLTMLLTDQRNIREVILFPHMRPETSAEYENPKGT
jgi:lysyl-tRNA synthetase class 2